MSRTSREAPSVIPELNVAVTLAIGRPRTVLDVRCGRGLHGAVAKRSGAHVVGIEGRADVAETARRTLDELIPVDPTDTEKLKIALGDRKFDLLLFSDMFHTSRDPQEVLRFFASYLEEGGRVMASFRNRNTWTRKLHIETGERLEEGSGGEQWLL